MPWSDQALEKAQKEDKPILVSIGYSACHWCHVMERESFENEAIAELMNQHFVCIKVDREERPDVDMIYMDAVQAMGINGGWPLNVFLTPDQKPFYGGTYFPPAQFTQVLANVHEAFSTHRQKLEESANQFMGTINRSEIEKYRLQEPQSAFSLSVLQSATEKLRSRFDGVWGGMQKSPKFMMPSIWFYLLRYQQSNPDRQLLDHFNLTLHKMALGGLYDTLGGGFARYSVDGKWFAPHFEKMLYDNGQLMSLYAEAYSVTQNPFYKEVVEQTFLWLIREMLDESGGFYAALDADSEGMEGKFYIWTSPELREVLGKDADLFMEYYTCSQEGNWEHGYNILFALFTPEQYSERVQFEPDRFKAWLQECKTKLFKHRAGRIRPGLDDKILSGWNALMLKGLCDAYAYLGDQKYVDLALANAHFMASKMIQDGRLLRTYKNGEARLSAYLEDYAAIIQAFIALYQVSFQEKWLMKAQELTEYTLAQFYDESEGLFFYNDASGEKLIARKKEVFDNVIPASNSLMAGNLYTLGLILDKADYQDKAKRMLATVQKMIINEPAYLSQWACLYTQVLAQSPEIAIVGSQAVAWAQEINRKYLPHKVIFATPTSSDLPLLKDKVALNGQTTIYVCFNKTCKLPVHSVEEALAQASRNEFGASSPLERV